MNSIRHVPISTRHLRRLIEQALFDLRYARRIGDAGGIQRAERRMNALLDQLSARKPAAAEPTSERPQPHLGERPRL